MPNLILLALLGAFPPLSTDMYLPAIPTLQALWDISYATANLSMVLFMATFSVFLLIHGPLSDRLGRKPVLIGGLILFILASLGCALSPSIGFLIACRCMQAAGAAAASSLALALSKDLYDGAQRQKILAYMGVIMALAPMLAPSIGGLMLKFASWRWIFAVQAGLALIGLYGVLRLKEPLTEFTRGGFLAVAGRYRLVLGNLPFTVLASGFALMALPQFAFIGGSADMYINDLGLSEQAFGIYFGANAIGFMLGSFLCTRMIGQYKPMNMLYTTFGCLLVSTALMFILGGRTPPDPGHTHVLHVSERGLLPAHIQLHDPGPGGLGRGRGLGHPDLRDILRRGPVHAAHLHGLAPQTLRPGRARRDRHVDTAGRLAGRQEAVPVRLADAVRKQQGPRVRTCGSLSWAWVADQDKVFRNASARRSDQ